jgi:hypothetical protein
MSDATHVYHVTPTEDGLWHVQKELMRFTDRQEAIDFARLLATLESEGMLKVHSDRCPLQVESATAHAEAARQ